MEVEEIKVSELPEATQLNDDDIIMIVQNGANKKITKKNLQKILLPKKEKILIKQDTITTSSGDIATDTIDFELYDKIIVQFADPGEGDSVIFEIDEDGVPINTVSHFYNFATNDYHCFGYVYIQDSKVKVHLQSLAGWASNVVYIYGIKK